MANRDIGAARDRARPTRSSPPARRSAAGALHEQFVVDMIQGGAGTSTNMNANEVIANRALEHPRARRAATTGTCTRSSTSTSGRAPTTSTRPRSSSPSTATSSGSLRRTGRAARGVRAQGRRVRRRAQDGPHPAAGRRADDAGPGVRRLRASPWARTSSGSARPGCCCTRSTSAAPRSAPSSTPTPSTAARPSPNLREITGIPTLVIGPRPGRGDLRTSGSSSSCPGCSSASR